jgi:hypothetical protein
MALVWVGPISNAWEVAMTPQAEAGLMPRLRITGYMVTINSRPRPVAEVTNRETKTATRQMASIR